MRAIVTGAAGFIGSTLVDRLLADGHQVVGVDNFRTGITANLEHALAHRGDRRFTLVRADIQAPELVDIVAGAQPHVIFHLAAQVDRDASVSDPQFDARSNVLGTINLCEASRQAGVRRIVYAASGASRYGDQDAALVDESRHVDPLSPHAVAKLAGEMYLRAYAGMYGLAPICLALADVYGPRQSPHGAAGAIAVVGSAMVTGRPFAVYRDHATAHDFVYVDDVVEAFVCAAEAPMERTGVYNIGTGRRTTMTDVHNLMAADLDESPLPAPVTDDGEAPGVIALDAAKAARELGWSPRVDITEGIRRTMQWLCDTLESESPALVGA
ncbi:MAG: GDP-mannose 4,6-dehydratase [Actinobacteria bacterium]|nr:GDP-mannose 4,6-dehydratase [Actinomycetota bacterium]